MNEINIEIIRTYILQRKISWTRHCLNRINQRNIAIIDIKQAILNGKIIECYENDYPYPSCLILGGVGIEMLYMITAYYPDVTKWNEDRRK